MRKLQKDGFSHIYAAIIFLLMAVLVLVRNSKVYDHYSFFWYCDISLVLFSFAFLTRNIQLIKGLINIGLFGQFIYILGVILYSALGISISNLPGDLLDTQVWNIIITISIHLFSTNVALLLTYKEKPSRISLFYSFLTIMLLYVLTILFTPASRNINYVFSSQFLFGLEIPFYIYLWPILVFVILVLPTYWFQRWISGFFRKPRSIRR